MPRAGLNADRVTAAAADLADEVGLDAVTLTALADRLGVRVASLYSHVASSRDLRTRLTLLALAELADRSAAELAGRSGREALRALGDVIRDYAREHPGRYAAAQLPLDHETALASAGVRQAELTRAVLRGYRLVGDDQTHAVRLLGSVFHGFVSLELRGAFSHSEPGSDASWDRTLDALDALLRTWPTDPEEPR